MGAALTATDFDHDGYDDLVIGIPGAHGRDQAGEFRRLGAVQVSYGGRTLHTRVTTDMIFYGQDDGSFGSVLTAGDFNGDRYPDLAIGEPYRVTLSVSAGAVTIINGNSRGLEGQRREWRLGVDGVPGTRGHDDEFGAALAAADFDGNGYDDLAIGIPGRDENGIVFDHNAAGEVLILRGGPIGFLFPGPNDFWRQDKSGVESVRDSGERFGAALSVGDFNRDNRADLVVGVPGEDVTRVISPIQKITTVDAGMLHIFYGTFQGLSTDAALGRETFAETTQAEYEEQEVFEHPRRC